MTINIGDSIKVVRSSSRSGEQGIVVEIQAAQVYRVRFTDGIELLFSPFCLEKIHAAP